MKEQIKLIILAVGAAIAAKLTQALISQGLTLALSISGAAVASVISVKLLELFLLELPMKWQPTRSLLDPKSAFEGAWLLNLANAVHRPYSFGVIAYNSHSSSYTFTGYAFDSKGKIMANWNASNCSIDLKSNEMRYFFVGSLTEGPNEEIEGYGKITFQKLGRHFTRGYGFFVDAGIETQKYVAHAEQFSRVNIKKLIGKRQIDSNEDLRKVIEVLLTEKVNVPDKDTLK